MSDSAPQHPVARLPAYDAQRGCYNAIVETPRGSRHKYEWESGLGLLVLDGVLPAGSVFPFAFGFIPSTRAEDGDPVDVLLLLDDAAPAGCLVRIRLLGAIEAEQTERDGETVRNDRLIAVATESYDHRQVQDLEQLSPDLLEQIEHFFASYNQFKGKRFRPIGRVGAERAAALVREAAHDAQGAEG